MNNFNDNKEEGLHINNNIVIKKISGPVSMTILKPKDETVKYFREFKNPIYAPIFILFGDVHESRTNLCNCEDDIKTCLKNVAELANKLIS